MNYFAQETKRLKFRKLTEYDIESWTEFFDNNDRLDYMGFPDKTKDKLTISTEWILMQLERYENCSLGHLAVIEKSTGKFIGMGGIIPRIVFDQNEFEIAYSLKPPFWGKGFGTEIALQLKKFGFENSISERFISIIHIENIDSMGVAKKNSMTILHETEYNQMPVFVFGVGN